MNTYAMWGGNGFVGGSIMDAGDVSVPHGSRLSLPGERLPEEWSGVIWSAGFPGIKNVDDVERNPIRSKLQNVWEPAELAYRCHAQGKRLLLIASGCIFNRLNSAGRPHSETDEPNFVCTVYLRDQKEKEERVAAACTGVTIFRIRVPFNGQHHPRNTLHKLMQFPAVWDIDQSYTWTEDLKKAVKAWKDGAIDGGIWHVTQPGTMSNYQIVKKYLNPKVLPITGEVHVHEKMACPRSAAILDNSKLAKIVSLTPAEEAFAISAKTYLNS